MYSEIAPFRFIDYWQGRLARIAYNVSLKVGCKHLVKDEFSRIPSKRSQRVYLLVSGYIFSGKTNLSYRGTNANH